MEAAGFRMFPCRIGLLQHPEMGVEGIAPGVGIESLEIHGGNDAFISAGVDEPR